MLGYCKVEDEEADAHSECTLSESSPTSDKAVFGSQQPSSAETSGQLSELFHHSMTSMSGLSEVLIEERDDMMCVCDDHQDIPCESGELVMLPLESILCAQNDIMAEAMAPHQGIQEQESLPELPLAVARTLPLTENCLDSSSCNSSGGYVIMHKRYEYRQQMDTNAL